MLYFDVFKGALDLALEVGNRAVPVLPVLLATYTKNSLLTKHFSMRFLTPNL
jgi:hypothetical protein